MPPASMVVPEAMASRLRPQRPPKLLAVLSYRTEGMAALTRVDRGCQAQGGEGGQK